MIPRIALLASFGMTAKTNLDLAFHLNGRAYEKQWEHVIVCKGQCYMRASTGERQGERDFSSLLKKGHFEVCEDSRGQRVLELTLNFWLNNLLKLKPWIPLSSATCREMFHSQLSPQEPGYSVCTWQQLKQKLLSFKTDWHTHSRVDSSLIFNIRHCARIPS